MKKWCEYSKGEKRMFWLILILILAIIISYSRIEEGVTQGLCYFYPELFNR